MADLHNNYGAIISSCGVYRYRLWRRWSDGCTCVFVMLNPSTADATQDDPTIRRCIGFAKREGCGGLAVVNLFAVRATSPAAMKLAADPIGPDNDMHIRSVTSETDGPVIAAWGTHGALYGRDAHVRHLIGKPLWCLSKTKTGAPGHPLYIKGDAPLLKV